MRILRGIFGALSASAAVLALAAAAPCGEATGEAETPEESFSLARSALDDKLYTFALKRFEELRRREGFGKRDLAAILAAECHLGLGEYDDAEKILNAFASEHRGSELQTDARLLLGRTFLARASQAAGDARAEMLGKALALFNEISKSGANRLLRADAEYYSARANFEMARFDEASRLFRKFLDVHSESPDAPDARLYGARALYQLYRFDEAVAILDPLVESAKSGARALAARQLRAECRYCLEDWTKALEDYRAAAALAKPGAPELVAARYGAGWALYRRAAAHPKDAERPKDLSAALEEFRAVAGAPEQAKLARSSAFKVGAILLELGRHAEAASALEAAASEAEGAELQAIRYLEARALGLSGSGPRAIGILEEIERSKGLSPELALAAGQEKAELLSDAGRHAEAAKVYRRLRDLAPNDAVRAETSFMSAMSLLKATELGRDRLVEARSVLEGIVASDKLSAEMSFQRLHYYLGRVLHELAREDSRAGNEAAAAQNMDLAFKEFAKVREFQEGSDLGREAAEEQADILDARGQTAQAAATYEGIIDAGAAAPAEKARLLIKAASARRRSGDKTKALGRYDEALALPGGIPGVREEALFGRADCLSASNPRAAAETYETFLKEFRTSGLAARAAFERGAALARLGDFRGAVESFDLCAELAAGTPLAAGAMLEAARSSAAGDGGDAAYGRYAAVASLKGEQAWEAEIALAGLDGLRGKPQEALARLGRVIAEAPKDTSIRARAAELAGRVHLDAGRNQKAEEMFRDAASSSAPETSAAGLVGLAKALYAQNRFGDAADAYVKLYYATKDQALREQAVRGAVAALREARPGAPKERRLEIIRTAMKVARLSSDRAWTDGAIEELQSLEKAEGTPPPGR